MYSWWSLKQKWTNHGWVHLFNWWPTHHLAEGGSFIWFNTCEMKWIHKDIQCTHLFKRTTHVHFFNFYAKSGQFHRLVESTWHRFDWKAQWIHCCQIERFPTSGTKKTAMHRGFSVESCQRKHISSQISFFSFWIFDFVDQWFTYQLFRLRSNKSF